MTKGETFSSLRMNYSRNRTPPRQRKRRNSFEGTPNSDSEFKGRKRSKSISSPSELKVGKNKSNVSKKNIREVSYLGPEAGARKYIRKKRKQDQKKQNLKKMKNERLKKTKERFSKINIYMADFGSRCSKKEKDIMKKITNRMRRYILSEIDRERYRIEDLAAQRIKDWYFKMLPIRREFYNYWLQVREEKYNNFEKEEEEDYFESNNIQVKTPNGKNPMTPENRIIRMKEDFQRKYTPSPLPSPSSQSKPSNYGDDYFGDELDELDDEYLINRDDSGKERESVDNSTFVGGVIDNNEESELHKIAQMLQSTDEEEEGEDEVFKGRLDFTEDIGLLQEVEEEEKEELQKEKERINSVIKEIKSSIRKSNPNSISKKNKNGKQEEDEEGIGYSDIFALSLFQDDDNDDEKDQEDQEEKKPLLDNEEKEEKIIIEEEDDDEDTKKERESSSTTNVNSKISINLSFTTPKEKIKKKKEHQEEKEELIVIQKKKKKHDDEEEKIDLSLLNQSKRKIITTTKKNTRIINHQQQKQQNPKKMKKRIIRKTTVTTQQTKECCMIL